MKVHMPKAFKDEQWRERDIQETLIGILTAADPAYLRTVDLVQFEKSLIDEVRFLVPCDEEEMMEVEHLCESIDYGYTASAQTEEIGPKFLRITDIVPQIIDWSPVPYCKIPDDKKEKFLLQEGDLVIARTGATVGYTKRLHKRHPEAVFASYLVRLRLKSEVDDLTIGIFVESEDYKKYVQSRIGGAAQPNANAKVLSGASLLSGY